jgi:hypothetical protein
MKTTQGASLAVTIPALKAVLNCTAVPEDSITITLQGSDDDYYCFNSTAYTIPDCPRWYEDDTMSCTNISPMENNVTYFDLWVQHNLPIDGAARSGPIFPGCPVLSVFYGELVGINETKSLNMLLCRPYIEQIDVETVFSLPDYVIDTFQPPRPIAETASIIRTEFINNDNGYIFPVCPVFPGSSGLDELTTGDVGSFLNPWFQTLIFGINGRPATQIFGQRNTDNVIGGLEHIFGGIMAEMLSSQFRNATPSTNTTPSYLPTFNGTIINPNRTRLVQSLITTRILQTLLGSIVLCAIVAFSGVDTRNVLPKNPYSIAALASLLAGSELLEKDIIPPSAEFRDDAFLRDHVFDGWLFSMGWWMNEIGEPRFGIDVGQYGARNREELVTESDVKLEAENLRRNVSIADGIDELTSNSLPRLLLDPDRGIHRATKD